MGRRIDRAAGARTANSVSDVEARIEELSGLGTAALRQRWREVTSREAGPGLKGELLRAALAHCLQEQAFGGVSPIVLRRLRLLAQEAAQLEATPDDRGGSACAPARAPRRIKPGSRLIREWRGVVHEVVVAQEGYLWNGTLHPSLSSLPG